MMTDFDLKALRTAFGSFMTGVTIVSTRDKHGQPIGFTANSFTSVSLEPPLLLVCPAKSLSSFDVFNECDYFHISVLSDHQENISNIFAASEEDRFSQVDWYKDQHGSPVIDGALARFSCKRDRTIDAGDHIILLGEVTEFESHDGQGLGYGLGGYFSLNMERKATGLQTHTQAGDDHLLVGAVVEHKGQMLLCTDKHNTLDLPQIEIEDETPSFDAIEAYLDELLGVTVSVGAVYSIFDHENSHKSSIVYRVHIDDELQPNGQFYDLDELSAQTYASRATRNIIKRYLKERSTGNHRLYVGSETRGKAHLVDRS